VFNLHAIAPITVDHALEIYVGIFTVMTIVQARAIDDSVGDKYTIAGGVEAEGLPTHVRGYD